MSHPDFTTLRRRIMVRILTTAAPSAPFGAYAFSLVAGLSTEDLTRALTSLLPPVLLAAAVWTYVAVTLVLRRGLAAGEGEPDGARLRRILELPRRIEVYALHAAWVAGGGIFGGLLAKVFGKSWLLVPAGMLVGLFAALISGLILAALVEADLRPVALQEFLARPPAHLRGTPFFWPRQRWYLPYAFGVALVTSLAFSGMVVWRAFQRAAEHSLDAVEMFGGLASREMVRPEIEKAGWGIVPPVAIITLLILVAFAITGWMLARRQSRAARAVVDSLRAMVAGNPEPPQWIATDESGDLARATASVGSEMRSVYEQLRAMAAGDLGKELSGDSGLIHAFRESQGAMLRLAAQMAALSRGEVKQDAPIAGDLGAYFSELQGSFRAMVEQARTIAQGDLRQDVRVDGALGEALRRMTEHLRQMVGETQTASTQIGDIVVSLQSAASQLSTATTEQVAAVTETANTMTEMAQTSAVSADRASELIKQGEAAASVVAEGSEAAESTSQAMGAISSSLDKVSGASTALAERVRRIDGIIETVGFLADQSSTLAINAAIEAARAGEAGKGFAVVAREIRNLAGDSRKAAGQVREILGEIRDSTRQVDGSVAAGTRTVEDGQRLVQRLAEIVSQLGVTVREAVGLMRQVEGSARQHQAGVGQVSQALTNLQRAAESIRDGARVLDELSGKAHGLASLLQTTSGTYHLPGHAA
jgi:methyl-accepting chemotaxis protein